MAQRTKITLIPFWVRGELQSVGERASQRFKAPILPMWAATENDRPNRSTLELAYFRGTCRRFIARKRSIFSRRRRRALS